MNDRNSFEYIIDEFVNNDTVLKMKEYKQHFDVNCYDHCYDVAKTMYKVTKKFHLDYRSATRAGMVHDLFLYDWHIKEGRKNMHAFRHGKIACNNASKIFELNSKEKDMIISHMWPATVKLPKSKEGMILTVVDKYCTVKESINYIIKVVSNKKILRYGIFIFQMLLIRIYKGIDYSIPFFMV